MADPHTKAVAMSPQPDNAQTSATDSTPPPQEAPDPDSDDLDDLDDMLDEFSATTLSDPPPASSGPGRPHPTDTTTKSTTTPARDKPAEDEVAANFSTELQKEMAALMGEIDESPEMKKQLDEMMTSLGADASEKLQASKEGGETATKTDGEGGTGPEGAFTDTIRRTMERMQASGEQASAAAAAGGEGEEDMLAQLLKEMAAGGGGEGGEEDFSKMLLGMMEQLTNKEILYEPMKELHDKFPSWMEKNEGKVKAEDMVRHKEQQGLVTEIVGRFERKGYSDENAGDREFIVERMQKMQAAGSLPADLVGDMKDAQEAFGDLDTGCAQQ